MALTEPAQDHVVLGGFPTPGKASFKGGAGSPRGWKENPGFGQNGGWLTFTGNGLAKFTIEVQLWKPEHFLQWEVLANAVLKRGIGAPVAAGPFLSGLAPKPVSIGHPLLTTPPISITLVVIEDVIVNDPSDDGMSTYEIKCIEWGKPTMLLSKPTSGVPSAKAPVPTAKDAADAEIAAKLAELRRLAGP